MVCDLLACVIPALCRGAAARVAARAPGWDRRSWGKVLRKTDDGPDFVCFARCLLYGVIKRHGRREKGSECGCGCVEGVGKGGGRQTASVRRKEGGVKGGREGWGWEKDSECTCGRRNGGREGVQEKGSVCARSSDSLR